MVFTNIIGDFHERLKFGRVGKRLLIRFKNVKTRVNRAIFDVLE